MKSLIKQERRTKVLTKMGISLSALSFFIFLFSLVSAQPPALFSGETAGYTLVAIEPPVSVKANTPYEIHIHVLNNSDSKLINSSLTCLYHLERPDGVKISEATLSLTTSSSISNLSYVKTINAGNFSTVGLYNLLIQCYDNGQVSGITRVVVDVTPSGFPNTLGFYFVFIVLIGLIFVFGYYTQNNYIMTLGSILILIFGFFIIKFGIDGIKDVQTTWVIGLVVWAIGIIAIFKSAEEQLKIYN